MGSSGVVDREALTAALDVLDALRLGNQGPDGMSELRGWLTPEARATL